MLASSNDQAAAIHDQGGSLLLSSGGCQVGTDNVELDSDGSEAEWQSFNKSIGMKVSPGSESSEGWCSRIRRASQNMFKQADDWAKKTQDHWDTCKRRNALEK